MPWAPRRWAARALRSKVQSPLGTIMTPFPAVFCLPWRGTSWHKSALSDGGSSGCHVGFWNAPMAGHTPNDACAASNVTCSSGAPPTLTSMAPVGNTASTPPCIRPRLIRLTAHTHRHAHRRLDTTEYTILVSLSLLKALWTSLVRTFSTQQSRLHFCNAHKQQW
eukprot:scaffold645877_cov55-Attheya_sp.AAC.2